MAKRFIALSLAVILIFTFTSCIADERLGPVRDNGFNDRKYVVEKMNLRPSSEIIYASLDIDPEWVPILENQFAVDNPGYTVVIDIINSKEQLMGAIYGQKVLDGDGYEAQMKPPLYEPHVDAAGNPVASDVIALKSSYADMYYSSYGKAGMDMYDFMLADYNLYFEYMNPGALRLGIGQGFSYGTYFPIRGYYPALTTKVLAYDKNMISDVGLNANRKPKNWDDIITYSSFLTKANSEGKFSRLGFVTDMTVEQLGIYDSGKCVIGANGYSFTMTDGGSGVIAALDFKKGLEDLYGGAENLDESVDYWSIENGTAAMMTTISPLRLGSDSNVDYMPLPGSSTATGNYVSVEYDKNYPVFGVNTRSMNEKGGWMFMSWFLSKGVIYTELERYKADPEVYVPAYLTFTPARIQLYRLLYEQCDDNCKKFMAARDEALSKRTQIAFYENLMDTYVEKINDNGTVIGEDHLDFVEISTECYKLYLDGTLDGAEAIRQCSIAVNRATNTWKSALMRGKELSDERWTWGSGAVVTANQDIWGTPLT